LPNEDQGYAYAAMQLPEAASLERSGDVTAKVEKALMHVPGVGGVTTVVGINILNTTQNTYSSVFFITLKDLAERTKPDEQYTAILANLNRTMRGVQEGIGFAFPPPSIPGIGTSGGVTMILEDRSGSNDLSFLTQNLNKFMAACKKRPEIAAAVPTYLPNVPQLYVWMSTGRRCNSNRSVCRMCMQPCRRSWAAIWSTTSIGSVASGKPMLRPRVTIAPTSTISGSSM
jgi:hydrophobic/amphiphilic exporter-1 (mainly G- bacteria), HAE1 family